MKLILSGIIKADYDTWTKIILVQPDEYKIDLMGRLSELALNAKSGLFQINYHICDKPLTEIELKEAHILSIHGGLTADYEANGYNYSSWTHGTDYDTVIKVGKHDLYNELINHVGKWVYFEINFN